jgi:hypothetical protein
MPNWVRNRLLIHGDTQTVKECLSFISSDGEHISLNKIVPKPKDIGEGWYDWCLENWGTKWEVNETYEDEEGWVCFETAWSTPEPVIQSLSLKYPTLSFEVEYADEDLGINCGRFIIKDGLEIESYTYGTKEACQIWGIELSSIFPDIYREEQIDKIIGED